MDNYIFGINKKVPAGNSPHFQFDENESPSNVITSFNAVKSSANLFPNNSTRRDHVARIMAPISPQLTHRIQNANNMPANRTNVLGSGTLAD